MVPLNTPLLTHTLSGARLPDWGVAPPPRNSWRTAVGHTVQIRTQTTSYLRATRNFNHNPRVMVKITLGRRYDWTGSFPALFSAMTQSLYNMVTCDGVNDVASSFYACGVQVVTRSKGMCVAHGHFLHYSVENHVIKMSSSPVYQSPENL